MGVLKRSSRSPGWASGATETSSVVISAMAGLAGRRTNPTSFLRISAARFSSAAVHTELVLVEVALPDRSRFRGGPGGGGAFLLEFLEFVAQGGELVLRQRLGVIEDARLETRAGKEGIGDVIEELAAQFDLERGSLASTGRIHIADVRRHDLGRSGQEQPQKKGGRAGELAPKPSSHRRHRGGIGVAGSVASLAETKAIHARISFSRPPEVMPSAAEGVARTSRPWG